MDAKNFALLARKLEALNYNDQLDPVSAPLVQKLVDDLVHTTESYRALKLKNAKAGQEVEQWQGKARPPGLANDIKNKPRRRPGKC